MQRTIVWTKEAGAELAEVDVDVVGGTLTAAGFAIGASPVPYRLDYELETAGEFAARRLVVRTRGAGWRRWLELHREPDASWRIDAGGDGDVDLPDPGGEAAPLSGALDCDLGLSPLFNTMPVLRHALERGGRGAVDFLMAWVSVPDLSVQPSPQRYTAQGGHARGSVIGFESGDFRAEIVFDAQGFVVDYPGIATRVGA